MTPSKQVAYLEARESCFHPTAEVERIIMVPEPAGSDEIRRFEAQYRQNPDSLVFARLADAHRKNGDPDRALAVLRDGIGRHPDYPSAHIVRARCLVDLERPAEAETSLRRVLELDGQNLVAMRGLASLAERREDPVEAVHWFERIAALDPMNAEAEAALDRLRADLPDVPPGMERLPAPREEWWSSPAPEVTGAASPETAESELDEPAAAEEALEPAAGVAEEIRNDELTASEAAVESRTWEAWWFEDPGEDETADDGDLLTRTMADLYVKQGLLKEAAAIYRELLADRPDDEGLRRALADVQRRLEASGEAPIEQDRRDAKVAARAVTDELRVRGPDSDPDSDLDAGPDSDSDVDSDSDLEDSDSDLGSDARSGSASATVGTSFSTHPVPERAGTSPMFRDWLERLSE